MSLPAMFFVNQKSIAVKRMIALMTRGKSWVKKPDKRYLKYYTFLVFVTLGLGIL